MTALAPGKPEKSVMIGFQTADSRNERCITRVIRLKRLEELTRNVERGQNQ